MTEVLAPPTGRRLDARYTLLERLGAGGQGEVRRAHDEVRGVDIALKILSPVFARSESAWAALEREYEITSRLNHPSILKVFPPERSGDVVALPMELASGGDLRRLRGSGYLEIVPVLLEIAEALEYAHQRGVVHRDLKPGNVLFDSRGRVKLADFGVAGVVETPGTEADGSQVEAPRLGLSPFTASPAQLRGEPPTPADDIYGLGALAYELLSGYPPYYPHFDVKRAIEEPVAQLVPTRQIPPVLGTLVMRMLAKRASRRPRSMGEVIEELDAALNDTLAFEFVSEAVQAMSSEPRPASPEVAHAKNAEPAAQAGSPEVAQAQSSESAAQAASSEFVRAQSPGSTAEAASSEFVRAQSPESGVQAASSEFVQAQSVESGAPAARSAVAGASEPDSQVWSDVLGATAIHPSLRIEVLPTRREPARSSAFQAPADATAQIVRREPTMFLDAAGAPERDESAPLGEPMHRNEQVAIGEAARRSEPAVRSESVRRVESAARGEPARRVEQAPRSESVRRVESALRSESVRTVESGPRGESARTVESGPRSESARTVESGPRSESARTVESGPRSESVRTVESGPRSESVRTVESGPRGESAGTVESGPRSESVRRVGSAAYGEPARRVEQAPRSEPMQRGEIGPRSDSRDQPSSSGRPAQDRPATVSARGASSPAPGPQPLLEALRPSTRTGTPPETVSAQAPEMPLTPGLRAERPRSAFDDLQLDYVPKVVKLQPMRARRWPWIALVLLVAIAAGGLYWIPQYEPDLLPVKLTDLLPPNTGSPAGAPKSDAQPSPASETVRPVPAPNTATAAPAGQSVQAGIPAPTADAAPGNNARAAMPTMGASTSTTAANAPTRGTGGGSTAAAGTPAAPPVARVPTAAAAATNGDAAEQSFVAIQASFNSRLASLERRGAGVWGGREFFDAKMLSAESVGAHDAGDIPLAQVRLNAASQLLDKVERRIPQALAAQLDAGEKALAAGQGDVAAQSFDLARRIDPGNVRAVNGLRRVRSLSGVLPLLADAENAERARNFVRAVQDYSQALSLDPADVRAKDGLARANAAFGDDNYAKSVGAGFAALGAGRLTEAHDSFEKARSYKPNGAEAAEGLRRVAAVMTARGYADIRQRAASLEAQERWGEAMQEYDQALKQDASLQFAQQGKARTAARADLSNRLQELIDRPERLGSPAVRQEARELLQTARSQMTSGPVLRSQIARLEILLPDFDKPVRLSLVSDNATQVAIPSIGEFGTFARREIDLKPGKYTVIGTRSGYHDVRRDITVAPGQTTQTVSIACSEPI